MAIILSGCMEDLEELDFSKDDDMFVYAILSGSEGDNSIYVSRLENLEPVAVYDAIVEIYINGKLSETCPCISMDDDENVFVSVRNAGEYWSTSTFQPGDKVTLKVSSQKAGKSVWAECVVPKPAKVSSTDTLKIKDKNNDGYVTDFYKTTLNIEAPDGGEYCYRLESMTESSYKVHRLFYYTFFYCDKNQIDYHEIAMEDDTVIVDRDRSVVIKDDLALTDGRGSLDDEHDEQLLSFESIHTNKYAIFSGEYFRGGRYSLSYETELPGLYSGVWAYGSDWCHTPGYEGKACRHDYTYRFGGGSIYDHEYLMVDGGVTKSIVYNVKTITREEYQYLRSRNDADDLDWSDVPFAEPVIVRGNINGGFGIFGIETSTEGRIIYYDGPAEFQRSQHYTFK